MSVGAATMGIGTRLRSVEVGYGEVDHLSAVEIEVACVAAAPAEQPEQPEQPAEAHTSRRQGFPRPRPESADYRWA